RLAWKRVEILRGAELVRTLPVAGAYDWLQVYEWSRDGRWLLIGTTLGLEETVWTLSSDGRQMARLFESKYGYSGKRAHFTPSGDGVLFLRPLSPEESDLVLLPLADGRAKGEGRALIDGLPARDFSLDRDGKKLAYTRSHGDSKLWLVTLADLDAPS